MSLLELSKVFKPQPKKKKVDKDDYGWSAVEETKEELKETKQKEYKYDLERLAILEDRWKLFHQEMELFLAANKKVK